jgi:PmbA protein
LAGDVTVIDHGVLKSFLVSRFGSKKTGIPRSLNYGGAYIIEPGDKSLEEIIASVDKGLLVGYLSCKNPDSSGEITGVAKNSFLIENGIIRYAVNETMISCNLLDILMNIRGISGEQVTNGYYKLPYIAFDGVVISGK